MAFEDMRFLFYLLNEFSNFIYFKFRRILISLKIILNLWGKVLTLNLDYEYRKMIGILY